MFPEQQKAELTGKSGLWLLAGHLKLPYPTWESLQLAVDGVIKSSNDLTVNNTSA